MKSSQVLPPQFKSLVYAVSAKENGNLAFDWGKEQQVLKNRDSFFAEIGIEASDCVGMELEHKDTVRVVSNTDKGGCILSPETCLRADSLITQEKGLYLFLLTADCIPLVYYDPVKEVVALVHLSWLNTGLGLAAKTVHEMSNQFGSSPSDVLAVVGPYIHKSSYRHLHPEQVNDPLWKPYLEPAGDEQFLIDLLSFNKQLLREAGLREENISASSIDTCASPEYFSHYRSKRTSEPEGRFATVVGMK